MWLIAGKKIGESNREALECFHLTRNFISRTCQCYFSGSSVSVKSIWAGCLFTSISLAHLCDCWKNQGLLLAPASLVPWCGCLINRATGGDVIVMCICKCGFDVGISDRSSPLPGWCVSCPDLSLVSSWCLGNTSECGEGKMGWVVWGSAPALKVFLAEAAAGILFSIQPIGWRIWVSLCLPGSQGLQLLMCWLSKASCAFGLQETVLWSCWSHIFVCFITCMIALAYVPLQEYGSWRKEGIKKPLMGFMLALKNVFSYENTVYGNLSHSLLWHGRKWLDLCWESSKTFVAKSECLQIYK